MADTKTKVKSKKVLESKEVYGPSPVLFILKDLKELLDDNEQYPW
jgi:hypothetical protein